MGRCSKAKLAAARQCIGLVCLYTSVWMKWNQSQPIQVTSVVGGKRRLGTPRLPGCNMPIGTGRQESGSPPFTRTL